jgi:hypothetical protein
MTQTSFRTELENAASHGSAPDRIEGTKTAVARQIHRADPAAETKFTDYFNHGYVPDIVLRWPHERHHRPVYIRTASNPDWISEDLELIPETGAFLYTPESVQLRNGSVDRQLRSGAMISGPEALEVLASSRTGEPTSSLIAHAVVSGGIGIVDDQAAREAVQVTEEAFEAAEASATAGVGRAATYWPKVLDPHQLTRMSRVLQAVWEGSGGRLSDFAFGDVLGGQLSDGDWQYLLSEMQDAGVDFWRRLAWGLTADQLVRLSVDQSAAFQDLMAAALESVQVKALRVLHEDRALDNLDVDPLRWFVKVGCIAFRGSNWTAYLAPNSQSELPSHGKDHAGITISELQARVMESHKRVIDIRLRGATSSITWESLGEKAGIDLEALENLATQTNGLLDQATIAASDGGKVSCDFLTWTASGRTSSKFSVGGILRDALFLLRTMSATEIAEIREAISASDVDLFSAEMAPEIME